MKKHNPIELIIFFGILFFNLISYSYSAECTGNNESGCTISTGKSWDITQSGITGVEIEGGTQNVETGGNTDGTTITGDASNTGTQNVNGGSTTNTIVNQYGEQILNNGTTNDTQVNDGGKQTVNGGQAIDTIITSANSSASAIQNVENGGTATNTSIKANGIQNVKSGGTANGAEISGNNPLNIGAQNVESGGIVSGTTTIKAYGEQNLQDGFVMDMTNSSNQIIIDGGTQNFGDTSGSTVSTIDIDLSTSNATITMNSGEQNLYNGVKLNGMTIQGTSSLSGTQNVNNGATSSNTTIEAYGVQNVKSSGTITGTTTINENAVQNLEDGFIFDTSDPLNQIVINGGIQNIEDSTNSVVLTGSSLTMNYGTQNVGSNITIRDIIIKGNNLTETGTQNINSGAKAINTTIGAWGIQNINSGATISGITTIAENGEQNLNDGFIFDNTDLTNRIIINGGTQTFADSTNAVTVLGRLITMNYGTQNIGDKVTLDGMRIGGISSTKNSTQVIKSGGIASKTIINAYGEQIVENGGTAIHTTINNGGLQTVENGGIAESTVIKSGGTQDIAGVVRGKNIIEQGGVQNISYGFLSTDTNASITVNGIQNITNSGPNLLYINDTPASLLPIPPYSPGKVNITVNSGGIQNLDGNVMVFYTNFNGGTQNITNGAASIGAIFNGGVQNIESGSEAHGTKLYNGTIQNVNGGKISNTDIYENSITYFNSSSTVGQNINANSGGSIIFNTNTITRDASETTATITLNKDSSLKLLNTKEITIGSDINITGNGGTLYFRIEDALNSDKMTFSNASGNFLISALIDSKYGEKINENGDFLSLVDVGASFTNFVGATPYTDVGLLRWEVAENLNQLGDWGLSKTKQVTDAVKSTTRSNLNLLNSVNMLSNSMYKRIGEVQWQNDNKTGPIYHTNSAMWIRGLGGTTSMTEENKIDSNLHGIEIGYDFNNQQSSNKLTENTKYLYDFKNLKANDYRYSNHRVLMGITGYFATGDSTYEQDYGKDGTSDLTALGGGLYVTWLSKGGWFLDTTVKGHALKQEIKAYSTDNQIETKYDVDNFAATASMELGKQIVIGKSGGNFSWFITPRIQGGATYLSDADFTTSTDYKGKYNYATSFRSTVGILMGPRFKFGKGNRLQIYGKASYTHEFDGEVKASLGDYETTRKLDESRYELGGGIDMQIKNSLFLYADGYTLQGSTYEEFAGTFGLRFDF